MKATIKFYIFLYFFLLSFSAYSQKGKTLKPAKGNNVRKLPNLPGKDVKILPFFKGNLNIKTVNGWDVTRFKDFKPINGNDGNLTLFFNSVEYSYIKNPIHNEFIKIDDPFKVIYSFNEDAQIVPAKKQIFRNKLPSGEVFYNYLLLEIPSLDTKLLLVSRKLFLGHKIMYEHIRNDFPLLNNFKVNVIAGGELTSINSRIIAVNETLGSVHESDDNLIKENADPMLFNPGHSIEVMQNFLINLNYAPNMVEFYYYQENLKNKFAYDGNHLNNNLNIAYSFFRHGYQTAFGNLKNLLDFTKPEDIDFFNDFFNSLKDELSLFLESYNLLIDHGESGLNNPIFKEVLDLLNQLDTYNEYSPELEALLRKKFQEDAIFERLNKVITDIRSDLNPENIYIGITNEQ